MKSHDTLLAKYENLIEIIYSERDSYAEEKLSLFTPAKGKEYQHELMIIGRATNGWGNKIDKNNKANRKRVIAQIKEALSDDDGLEWVIKQWGATKNGIYNTRKSAFFRLSRMLAQEIIENSETVMNKIVWSNLYKAAKLKTGKANPSDKLCDVQLEICKELLLEEFDLFKPKVVIFLTGWSWAKDFLGSLKNKIKQSSMTYVEFAGYLNETLIIVAQHPQGKPEEPHYKEIMTAIKKSQQK